MPANNASTERVMSVLKRVKTRGEFKGRVTGLQTPFFCHMVTAATRALAQRCKTSLLRQSREEKTLSLDRRKQLHRAKIEAVAHAGLNISYTSNIQRSPRPARFLVDPPMVKTFHLRWTMKQVCMSTKLNFIDVDAQYLHSKLQGGEYYSFIYGYEILISFL